MPLSESHVSGLTIVEILNSVMKMNSRSEQTVYVHLTKEEEIS